MPRVILEMLCGWLRSKDCARAICLIVFITWIGAAQAAEKVLLHPVAGYGTLPLAFELNAGQTDRQVKFLARGQGYTLFLTSTEAVLALRHQSRDRKGAGRTGTTNNPQITQITQNQTNL